MNKYLSEATQRSLITKYSLTVFVTFNLLSNFKTVAYFFYWEKFVNSVIQSLY